LIWSLYRDLKAYRQNPSRQRRATLRARFDRIFTRKTGFVTLDRLLARLHANKRELLMVLDRPEIPLHTNGSENDVRCQVTKRKVSGGTRSDMGRDCRDAFLGLNKTCAKLGIAFWDYLGSRLSVPNQAQVPHLPASSSTAAPPPECHHFCRYYQFVPKMAFDFRGRNLIKIQCRGGSPWDSKLDDWKTVYRSADCPSSQALNADDCA
jgi:hypothetical protein